MSEHIKLVDTSIRSVPHAQHILSSAAGLVQGGLRPLEWLPEREGVGADGREQDCGDIRVHHGAACCHGICCAASWRCQHHAIRLHLDRRQSNVVTP